MASRVRVFIAQSIDGFIAGPNDDLSWLPSPVDGDDFGYGAFIEEVGAILMGRRTYDVASRFDPWPYAGLPVLVATSRTMAPRSEHVRVVQGSIDELVQRAREAARGLDVYLDGGTLIRAALDADLIDELTVTVIPTALGAGAPLFAGLGRRHAFELVGAKEHAGLVQLVLRPRTPA